MQLTENEIKEFCLNPANQEAVDCAQKNQIAHDRHVSGRDFMELVKPLKGFEKEDEKRIKEQLAKPATVPLVSDIRKVLSKWISATDTFKDYKFKSGEQKEKEFRSGILSDVWKGQSMDYFVNHFLNNALWNKFNDFLVVTRSYVEVVDFDGKEILFEIRDGIRKPIIDQNADLKPFIAHIDINAVHDFLIYGNKVEYLIYCIGENDKEILYKVLDDSGSYSVSVKKGSKDTKEVEITSFVKNELNELTAIRVSSLLSQYYENTATSYLEPAIYNLNQYVNEDAIHQVSKIRHGFPYQWAAASKCTYQDLSRDSSVCENGKMDIVEDDERKSIICPQCNGTGYRTIQDPSQTFLMPFLLDNEQKPYSNEPIGYAKQPIDVLEFQREGLKAAKNNITAEILSKNNILLEQSIAKTATEVMENNEPVVLFNIAFSNLVAFTEQTLTDWIGRMFSDSYEGSTINYGTNYANKNASLLTDEIDKSKKAGISLTELTQLHKKRIKSENSKNPNALIISKILFELEPFNTFTIDEVEKSSSISESDKIYKLYFPEYVKELKESGELNMDTYIDNKNYDIFVSDLRNKINNLHEQNLVKIKSESEMMPKNDVESENENTENNEQN
jgi:hypothetical protein